ncbi:hypothetical protein Pint_29328 [Pistacia integerrima]|uniref:Uncharacterized protein n=1 Tax=Pistacia integerrima TaxID=434235 RepID=A0ACC0X2S4_9ROSI|nr:hypothetical protein Pint_29328 [Pistacia integerrima]
MATLSLNVGNFITLRLTPNNYPLWREQALALAESQELVGHLTNEDPAPNKYSDRLLRGWIIGTLSEEALSLVVGLDTAHAVWEALKNAYAQESQEREFTLRQQLTYLQKEDHTTITEHIRTFKGLCDNLATIGKPILDQEKVFCLLTSLGPQYETFTTTMLKPPRPSYSELVSQLQNYDQRRNWFSNHIDVQASTLTHPVAFYGKKTNVLNQTTQDIVDQHKHLRQLDVDSKHSKAMIQGKPTTPLLQVHNADLHHQICWWVPKKSTPQNEIPQALAALTLDNTIADTEWTTDTELLIT